MSAWKLFINDEKGNLFKFYDSKGPPPKYIYWDGRGDDGRMMNPGITYYYTAEAFDSLGNVSRTVGRTLVVKGILYKEKSEWIIALRGNRIWSSERSTTITEDGELLLQEAADIVKRFFTRKLTVQVYSREESLSKRHAEIIADWLLNHMLCLNILLFTSQVLLTKSIRALTSKLYFNPEPID